MNLKPICMFVIFAGLISTRRAEKCFDSCAALPVSFLSDQSKISNCFCTQCDRFDDCCADITPPAKADSNDALVCGVRLDSVYAIYAVARCAADWPNDRLRQQCEQPDSAQIDQLLPIYSNQSNQTFMNVFCAICNLNSIRPENIELLSLEFDHDAVLNFENKTDLVQSVSKTLSEQVRQNRVRFKLPTHLKDNVRYCINAVDYCSNGTQLMAPCPDYTAYRFGSDGKAYKNEECAKCNGLNRDQISCFPPLIRGYSFNSLQLLFQVEQVASGAAVKLAIRVENAIIPVEHVCANQSRIELKDKEICSHENKLQKLLDERIVDCHYIPVDRDLLMSKSNAIITIGGQTISIASLAVLLSIYGANKALRNEPGKILMNLAGSLMLSQVSFMVATYLAEPTVSVLFQGRCENRFGSVAALLSRLAGSAPLSVCFVGGLLTHYFYLSFFAWSHVTAFDLQRTLGAMRAGSGPGQSSRRLTRYALFAWLAPVIIVAALLLSQLSTRRLAYAYRHCFISHPVDHKLAFVLPVALVLLANSVLLALAIRSVRAVDALSRRFLSGEHSRRALLRSTGSSTQESSLTTEGAAATTPSARANQGRTPPADPSAEKQRLVLFLKLFLLTGMTWMLGLLSSLTDSSLVWIVYILLNSLQGLFILLSFALSPQTQQHIQNSRLYRSISSSITDKFRRSPNSQTTDSFS
nr:G protein-coupled receptor [Proales similis]